jgi:hypothetical protein
VSETKNKIRAKRVLATISDYQVVFKSEHGRRVLWDLMKHSGMLSPSTISGDPYATHYNDGMRSISLYILQKLNADANQLEQIIKGGHSEDRAWGLYENESGS